MALSIVIIGPDYPDSLESNLADALRRCGHSVEILAPMSRIHANRWARAGFDLGSKVRPTGLALQRWLLGGFPAQADLTIVTTSAAVLLWPETVSQLKRRSRYVVCWFVDAVVHFSAARFLACAYDRMFFSDRGLAKRLAEGYGLPADFLPEGSDPQHHQPQQIERRPFVAVVGSVRSERVALLRRLAIEERLHIKVFGGRIPLWASGGFGGRVEFKPWVAQEAKARVFSQAAAVLNNLHPGHIDAVNCRVFEAGGSGGLVVTEWRPVLGELFTPESELLSYRTYEELVEQLKAALEHPDAFERQRHTIAGRVMREHTLDHRARHLVHAVTADT